MLFKLFSFLVAARYCCSKSVAAAATAGAVDLNDASATATIEAARSRRGNVWRYEPSHAWCRGRGLRDGCGPYWWGRLPGFETCSLTTESTQSPIDIVTSDAKYSAAEDHALPEVAVQDGGCSSWTQFASIAAYEVSFEEAGCRNLSLIRDGVEYEFKHLHFHSPSEHTIDGQYAVAELHMVHVAVDGSILVVGVLLDLDAELFPPRNSSPLVARLWEAGVDYNATRVEAAEQPLNPYVFLEEESKGVFSYSGSLTTPPCTEGVQWFVLASPRTISLRDLTNLRRVVLQNPDSVVSEAGDNNRPAQPLLSRTVHRNFDSSSSGGGGGKSSPKDKPEFKLKSKLQ